MSQAARRPAKKGPGPADAKKAKSRRTRPTTPAPSAPGAPAAPVGRPPCPLFTAKKDEILDRIAGGEEVKNILAEEGMPLERTFYGRLVRDPEFLQSYARAREAWTYAKADEAVMIADDTSRDTILTGGDNPREVPNTEWIQRSKLRVETRMRLAASYNAKRFGPKVDLTTDGEKLEHGVLLMPDLAPRPVERSVSQSVKGGRR